MAQLFHKRVGIARGDVVTPADRRASFRKAFEFGHDQPAQLLVERRNINGAIALVYGHPEGVKDRQALDECAPRVKDLHAIVAAIRHIDPPFRIAGHAFRKLEMPVVFARLAFHAQKWLGRYLRIRRENPVFGMRTYIGLMGCREAWEISNRVCDSTRPYLQARVASQLDREQVRYVANKLALDVLRIKEYALEVMRV